MHTGNRYLCPAVIGCMGGNNPAGDSPILPRVELPWLHRSSVEHWLSVRKNIPQIHEYTIETCLVEFVQDLGQNWKCSGSGMLQIDKMPLKISIKNIFKIISTLLKINH